MTPDMDVTADVDVPPTAPGRLPLVGHLVPLLRDRLEYVERLRTYGPIVRMSVGPKKVTVVNSHELIHEMLTSKSGSFSKGLLGEKLKLFGQSALPVAEGGPHLRRRRLLQPAFHREQISGYVTTMRETVEPSIAGWREGELLDLKTEMGLMAQDVAMSVLCSFRAEQERARAILDAVDTVFTAAIWRTMVPVSSLERLPTRSNRRLKAARSLLRSEVADIIAERRAEPDAHDDLVTLLLEARDETGAPLPDNEILSEIIGLLAAGSETTGVMLAWLFHELGRDPELERRLHEEVDSVVGEGPITAEHVPRLAFTRRLVSETLRLHHAGWLVTRQATRPVRLGPVDLPAGSRCCGVSTDCTGIRPCIPTRCASTPTAGCRSAPSRPGEPSFPSGQENACASATRSPGRSRSSSRRSSPRAGGCGPFPAPPWNRSGCSPCTRRTPYGRRDQAAGRRGDSRMSHTRGSDARTLPMPDLRGSFPGPFSTSPYADAIEEHTAHWLRTFPLIGSPGEAKALCNITAQGWHVSCPRRTGTACSSAPISFCGSPRSTTYTARPKEAVTPPVWYAASVTVSACWPATTSRRPATTPTSPPCGTSCTGSANGPRPRSTCGSPGTCGTISSASSGRPITSTGPTRSP